MMNRPKKNLIIAFCLTSVIYGVGSAQASYPYFGPPPTAAEQNAAPSRTISVSIVGAWKLRQEYPHSVLDYRLEFHRSGSYSMESQTTDGSGNSTSSHTNGRYTIDESNGTIHMVVQGNDQTSKLQILGDVLLLEDDDDQLTFVFRRP